jgi:hypothetical protein
MKITKPLSIIAAGFLGLLLPASHEQEAASRVETPSTATVSAGKSRGLSAGDHFTFQLRFNRAPEGYGSGTITCAFRNEQTSIRSANFGGIGEQISTGVQTELQDDQAIYNFSITIDDRMAPGTWRLESVSFGRTITRAVTIPTDVTFEIRKPIPVPIQVQAPGSITAGHRYVFKVNFGEIPKESSPDCVLGVAGSLRSVGEPSPDGHPTSGAYGVAVNSVNINPDQHSYELSGLFPPDLPGGAWRGEVEIYGHPTRPQTTWFCRTPALEGNTHFSFVVEPAPDLVTPTSVDVTVNPSQIQLLRGEADRLRAKAEQLSRQLRSGDTATNQVILQTNLHEAMDDLDKTEVKYKEIGTNPLPAQAVGVFFDDIRFSYGEALRVLANESAQSSATGPRFERVGAALAGPLPRLSHASDAVVASILHNAEAYSVVASSGEMTFTLDVYSDPPGATISYRTRITEYLFLDHDTDWHIDNLPRAVYLIRLQKTGYEDQERPFDAIKNKGTSIKITLKQSGVAP